MANPKVFFSADTHFGHANICKYCDRDFKTVHDMNEEITRQWNKTVGPKDSIYFLGDLTIAKNKVIPTLDRLNGQIYFVYGNHDWKMRGIIAAHEKVVWTGDIATPTYDKTSFTLCHYAMRVWNKSHYGAIHLHGHSHGTLPAEGKSLDVGVDNAYRLLGEYRPFTLEEVLHFTADGQKVANGAIYDYVEYIYKTIGDQLDPSEFKDAE